MPEKRQITAVNSKQNTKYNKWEDQIYIDSFLSYSMLIYAMHK